MKELTVIIPVYNESDIIQTVIKEWMHVLNELKIDYIIVAYNDGSTDNSLSKLKQLGDDNSKLKIIDKSNSGHGPTILKGYRDSESEWIFQIDSDNEIKADNFPKFWLERFDNDFIIGNRENRESPLARKLISFFSKITINIFYGTGINDMNCPYRLYKKDVFEKYFKLMPGDTFAPNVILSGIALKTKMKVKIIDVSYNFRETGEVSIKKFKLIKAAIKSWWQTVHYRYTL